MKGLMTILTAALLCAGMMAGEFSVRVNAAEPAIETDVRCENWQAKTINRRKEALEKNPSYVDFYRKEFTIEEMSASAVIHVSCQTFKLYINGEFVNDGAPRTHYKGKPYYCSYDVTSFVQAGTNVLAFEARGAVVAQLEFRDESGSVVGKVVTDESWKASYSPWQTTSHDFHVPGGKTEIYLAREEPGAWKQVGYDDAQWESVHASPCPELVRSELPPFVREVCLPRSIAFQGEVTEHWGAPLWHEGVGLQMATEVLLPSEKTSLRNADGLLKEDNAPTVVEYQYYIGDQKAYDTYWDNHDDMPLLRSATLIVDFGEIRNGFIALDIEGAGGTVDIGWGQTLIDGRVHTLSRLYKNGQQQHACRYVMARGRRQWEAFTYQNFRYLQLTFRKLSGPVKLHRIAAVRSEQPLETRGKFTCSDPLLNKFFTSSDKTFRSSTYDVPMDETFREKSPWGGDCSESIVPTGLSVYGDVPVLRHYLGMFTGGQAAIGEGFLPMTGFSGGATKFFFYAIRTAVQLANFGFWCSDPDYYESQILPSISWYIDYLAGRAVDRGLLVQQGNENNWVDHVRRDPTDVSVPMNLHYAFFLRHAAEVAEAYGDPARAQSWRDAAEVVCRTIRSDYWDEAAGLYRDGSLNGTLCPNFSTHANYLALLCGLGDGGRKERILAALNDPAQAGEIIDFGGLFYIWPHMALFSIGEPQAALDLMRNRYSRFYRNEDGGDTFWEEASYLLGGHTWDPRYRSLSFLGNGSPPWFLHREILGVKPTKPRFAEFTVEPKPCDLTWAEGVVPSPAGDIPVRWEKKGKKLTLSLTVPKGTVAKVKLPGSDKFQTLNPGKHTVKQ